MSIKIHHGPDGTYKTSGAIKDDIIGVIKSGRTLVTNVRGFTLENAIEVLGEDFVHDDFNVIHVDTDSEEGRQHLARFFHWAPKGAFFVIDEVQRIFPPKWTEKQLTLLNYPEPQDHLSEDERRPENIHVAWDMQRHHNWDFVFTTTNIKKVHEMARVMAKVAVRHVNTGIWRFYKTVEHDAESNGKTQASITTVKLFNFVPQKIFKLYASTTTGTFENTEPRTPFYKDFKILSLLLFVVGLYTYLWLKPAPKAMGGDGEVSKSAVSEVGEKTNNTKSAQVSSKKDSTETSGTTDSDENPIILGGLTELVDVPQSYLNQFDEVYLNGYSKSLNSVSLVFTGFKGHDEYQFGSEILTDLGVQVLLLKECLVQLQFMTTSRFVFCQPNEVKAVQQQRDFQQPDLIEI